MSLFLDLTSQYYGRIIQDIQLICSDPYLTVDPGTGQLSGALSDLQAAVVRDIVAAAGQPFEYVSLPDAAHAMHQVDPARFAQVLTKWARTLPA